VTADDVSSAKPDALVYRVACANLGAQPSVACAFEDSCSGVVAAKSADLYCVGVTSEEKISESLLTAGADCVIPDFNNLTLESLQGLLQSSRIMKP
jgi:beta-phosphoglucomutase